MALAQETESVFMDEPTTWLDVRHQLEVMRTARALAENGRGRGAGEPQPLPVPAGCRTGGPAGGGAAASFPPRRRSMKAARWTGPSGPGPAGGDGGGWQYYCEEPPEGGVHNG